MTSRTLVRYDLTLTSGDWMSRERWEPINRIPVVQWDSVKSYIESDQCRGDTLLKHFQAHYCSVSPSHLCCDVCACKCDCGLPEFSIRCHKESVLYPTEGATSISTSIETIINRELIGVCEWLNTNKLTLNLKKSNYVIFHPHQKSWIIKLN